MEESKISVEEEKPSENKTKIPGLESIVSEILLDDDDDDDDELQIIEDKPDIVSIKDDTIVSEPDPIEELDIDGEEMKMEGLDEEDDDVIIHEVVPDRIVLDDDDNKDGYTVEEGTHAPDIVRPVKIKKEDLVLDDGFIDVENGVVKMKGFEVKVKSEPLDTGKDFSFIFA